MILANVIESAFGPLISFFQAILVGVHSVVGGSWGWSIVGLTLIVRLVTLPLTVRQFKGMAQMRAHAPEIKKIQERYKEDKRRQQEEMMKYYKEVGYNPLSSCLPLLLQAPVFISLVYMLRTDLKSHICGAALKAHHIITSAAIAKQSCNKLVPHSASFLFVDDITSKAAGTVPTDIITLVVIIVPTYSTISTISTVPVALPVMSLTNRKLAEWGTSLLQLGVRRSASLVTRWCARSAAPQMCCLRSVRSMYTSEMNTGACSSSGRHEESGL